jgi:outer membrane receptor protein involved in Fe transport
VTEGSSEQTQDVREQVAEVTAQADLPGIGGVPLTIVAGTSWRDESADTRSRRFPESLEGLRVEPAAAQGYRGLPASYSGQANIFERTSTVDSSGSYSVWEVFGEAMMPLLRDRAFAQRLDFHAALREARYSGSGTIPAWKGGLDWQVNDSLRFRATRSRDIRAGSLSERFDSSLSGTTIVDRVLPAEPTYAVAAVRLGNPEIDPEKSDTTTAGLVLTPLLLPGFSFSADYYDIRIHDAISQLGVQTTINRCAEGELELCAMITRNETTGLITYVRNDVLNVAQARSRGIDFEASWRGPVRMFGAGESLALRMFANRTFESSTIGASGELLDRAGQTGLLGGAPPWQVNLSAAYRHGPVEVTLQERLISAGNYNNAYGPDDIDNNHVDGVAYTNLRISWQSGNSSGLLVYLGLINLFDQDPPRAPDWGFGGSIATNESLFDVLGRRIVLGVRWEQ